MTRASSFISLGSISLDPDASIPLYHQLYESLRSAILSGRIAGETRLPSSRALADSLGISRNTVLYAYDQLKLEGYFEGRTGSGTFVSGSLPNGREKVTELRRGAPADVETIERRGRGGLSYRGAMMRDVWRVLGRDQYRSMAFRPGLPALDAFPLATWNRLTARRWRDMPADLLTYGDPAGYRPLRELIAAYALETRGIQCAADQVIIVSGTPEALSLAAAVLIDRGDIAWIEDPGSPRARGILMASDAQVIPIPSDEEGLMLEVGLKRAPKARLVYVTPSSQYPLGTKMSLARRMELVRWAAQTEAWIIEDSHGSEYRAAGPPMAALQGAAEAGCVIHTGSFSQLLFPALNIGYLIVPPRLTDAFIAARMLTNQSPPPLDQVVMADFMTDGHLERHTRRVKALHATRRAALAESLSAELGGLIEVQGEEDGAHLVALLPEGVDDRALSQRIASYDIEAPPLSFYTVDPPARGGFILGYAAVDEKTIRIGVRRMRTVLREAL